MLRKLLSAAIIFSITLAAILPGVSKAQSAGQGLEISPPLLDLKADPGKSIKSQIKLRNVTSTPLKTKAQYDDFVAGNEEGQPKLLLNESEQSPYSIKDWLSSVPSVTLAPGEQKALALNINVPANASPGGHYGVVRFTASAPEADETSVSLSASVGSLILVTVSGKVTESAQIIELSAASKGHKRSLFEYGPVDLVTRIRNTGNVHVRPSGTVRVTNIWGKEVGSYSLNQTKGNVLPGSVRKFNNTLNKKLLFGRYKIQADVAYGSDQKIISATKTFWAIPYKLVAIALALLLLLIFLIRYYNRFILKRAASKNTNGRKSKSKDKS